MAFLFPVLNTKSIRSASLDFLHNKKIDCFFCKSNYGCKLICSGLVPLVVPFIFCISCFIFIFNPYKKNLEELNNFRILMWKREGKKKERKFRENSQRTIFRKRRLMIIRDGFSSETGNKESWCFCGSDVFFISMRTSIVCFVYHAEP